MTQNGMWLAFFCFGLLFAGHMACAQTEDSKELDEIEQRVKALKPRKWTLGEVSAAADTIVVATLSSERECGDEEEYKDLLKPGEGTTCKVMEAKFDVVATFKGEAEEKSVTLVYLQLRDDVFLLTRTRYIVDKFLKKMTVPDWAPTIWSEDEAVLTAQGKEVITPQYLLFLKQRDDKKFELATGDNYGPASVRLFVGPVAW